MNEKVPFICPFGSRCTPFCMCFVTESDEVTGDMDEGVGHCAFAVLASHVASERHIGGNYLISSMGYMVGGDR